MQKPPPWMYTKIGSLWLGSVIFGRYSLAETSGEIVMSLEETPVMGSSGDGGTYCEPKSLSTLPSLQTLITGKRSVTILLELETMRLQCYLILQGNQGKGCQQWYLFPLVHTSYYCILLISRKEIENWTKRFTSTVPTPKLRNRLLFDSISIFFLPVIAESWKTVLSSIIC